MPGAPTLSALVPARAYLHGESLRDSLFKNKQIHLLWDGTARVTRPLRCMRPCHQHRNSPAGHRTIRVPTALGLACNSAFKLVIPKNDVGNVPERYVGTAVLLSASSPVGLVTPPRSEPLHRHPERLVTVCVCCFVLLLRVDLNPLKKKATSF